MEDRFLEDILDNFFNTGILKCSVYQLNAIYTLTRKKILENNGFSYKNGLFVKGE